MSRTISTRIAIDGEKEYKQAITNVNRELKTLASELDLVKSNFKSNSDSQEALMAKTTALTAIFDKQTEKIAQTRSALDNARNSVDKHRTKCSELTSEIEKNTIKLERYKNETGDTSAVQAELSGKIAELKRQLDQSEKAVHAADIGVHGWTTSLNKSQIALNNTQSEIAETNSQLNRSAENVDEATDALSKYNKLIGELEADMKKATSTISANSAEISTLEANYKGTTKSSSDMETKANLLKNSIDNQREKILLLNNALEITQQQYGENSVEANKYREQLAKANMELSTQAQTTTNVSPAIAKIGELAAQSGVKFDIFSAASKKLGVNLVALNGSTGVVGVIAMVISTLVALVKAGEKVSKLASEYETSMVAVNKNIEGTPRKLKAIENGIIELTRQIPELNTNIIAVSATAGQLGIATEDILEFTKVMVAMGAATNLQAEEAAMALAKFANITKMSADDYERLGSTIVHLGNNFATTEADIVSMAMRLASTGSMVGMTEPQILALSTSMSALGIEAEAGGSSLSSVLKTLEVAVSTGTVEDFAKVAGLTSEEFSNIWKNNPTEALLMFVKGLVDVEKSGGSVVKTLEELNIKEIRQSSTLLALTGGYDTLKNAVGSANVAWEENLALSEESAKAYDTYASKTQILNNALADSYILAGKQWHRLTEWSLPILTNIVNGFNDFVYEVSDLNDEFEETNFLLDEFNTTPAQKAWDDYAKAVEGAKNELDALKKAIGEMLNENQAGIDESVKELNKFGDVVAEALKNRYDVEYELMKNSYEARTKKMEEAHEREVALIQSSIDNAQTASEQKIHIYQREYLEKCKYIDSASAEAIEKIQQKIDKIDADFASEQEAKKVREYGDKISKLQSEHKKQAEEINAAKIRGDKEVAEIEEKLKKIEAEMEEVMSSRRAESRQKTIEAEKNSLAAEIALITEKAQKSKEIEEEQLKLKEARETKALDDTLERYLNQEKHKNNLYAQRIKREEDAFKFETGLMDELTTSAALQAEARELIMSNNQEEILGLLESYCPEYQDVGQKLGDFLTKGMQDSGLSSYIDSELGRITQLHSQIAYSEELMRDRNEAQGKYEAQTKEANRKYELANKSNNKPPNQSQIFWGSNRSFSGGTDEDMQKIGNEFTENIAKGVKDESPILEKAMDDTINSSKDAILKNNKINSPAKLWSDEIGVPLSQGVGGGFVDDMKIQKYLMMAAVEENFVPIRKFIQNETKSINESLRQSEKSVGGDKATSINSVYNVSIDAKNVKEFNDIVKIASGQKQSSRMGFVGV